MKRTRHSLRVPEEFDPLQSNLCLVAWCKSCQSHHITSCDALACGECTIVNFCDDCEQCQQHCKCDDVNNHEILSISQSRYEGHRPVTEYKIKYGHKLYIIYDYDMLDYVYAFVGVGHRKVSWPSIFDMFIYIMEALKTSVPMHVKEQNIPLPHRPIAPRRP